MLKIISNKVICFFVEGDTEIEFYKAVALIHGHDQIAHFPFHRDKLRLIQRKAVELREEQQQPLLLFAVSLIDGAAHQLPAVALHIPEASVGPVIDQSQIER